MSWGVGVEWVWEGVVVVEEVGPGGSVPDEVVWVWARRLGWRGVLIVLVPAAVPEREL